LLSFLVVFRRLFQGLRRGWAEPQFRGLLYLSMVLLLTGMFFYHRVEGWTLFQSFYFAVLTLTTVGYGDFAPQTTAGRAFTIFYILIGLGIVVALVSQIATHATGAHVAARAKRKGGGGPSAEPSSG
jgi:hypothetical protein